MVDRDDEEVARLERLNDELKTSLRRLLHDYEARLAANSNDPGASADDQERGEA